MSDFSLRWFMVRLLALIVLGGAWFLFYEIEYSGYMALFCYIVVELVDWKLYANVADREEQLQLDAHRKVLIENLKAFRAGAMDAVSLRQSLYHLPASLHDAFENLDLKKVEQLIAILESNGSVDKIREFNSASILF